jgi:predicted dehydrogenase
MFEWGMTKIHKQFITGGRLAVRVGVIGVGYLGQHHARIYSDLEGVVLVGVADSDTARADEIAAKYGCNAFSHYKDLIDNVDALSIVTPTTTHYAVARDCLKAGKDVLIEKPITTTVREADTLIREAGKKGCLIHNPAIIAASGLIHAPVFIESERVSPFLGRGTDVDVTLDLMIHDIDIMLSLVAQPIKRIWATGAKVLTDKIDVAKAWLEFQNGCAALATVSRLSPEKQRTLKVFQKDSHIVIDYQSSEIQCYFRDGQGISSEVKKPEKKEPLREELKDFIRCVQERRQPKVSAVEGRNALKVVLEITKKIHMQG